MTGWAEPNEAPMHLVYLGYEDPGGFGFTVDKEHPEVGSVFDLPPGEELCIGRWAQCDVYLFSNGVARKHALVIHSRKVSVVVVDLGSTNGLWHRGERREALFLCPGDEFLVANAFRFRVELGPAPAQPVNSTSAG
jgi:pSer/pThr/pTyr-binding forkhead associated (FHA) protein